MRNCTHSSMSNLETSRYCDVADGKEWHLFLKSSTNIFHICQGHLLMAASLIEYFSPTQILRLYCRNIVVAVIKCTRTNTSFSSYSFLAIDICHGNISALFLYFLDVLVVVCVCIDTSPRYVSTWGTIGYFFRNVHLLLSKKTVFAISSVMY